MATPNISDTKKSNGFGKTTEDIEQIRADIDSLKSHLATLTQHFSEDTGEKAELIKKSVASRYAQVKKEGAAEYEKLEQRIRDNPGRSLLLAAVVGVVAGALLGRK